MRGAGSIGGPTLPEGGLDLDAELVRVEKAYLQAALQRSNGVKVVAAKLLGMTFRSFRYRLEKLGMAPLSEESDGSSDGEAE